MTTPEDPVRIRARRREPHTEITVLMPHPMDTGLLKDVSGSVIARHHITDVQVTVAGRTVFEARMTFAVSRDPLLGFRCIAGQPGDLVIASWTDNLGARRSGQTRVV